MKKADINKPAATMYPKSRRTVAESKSVLKQSKNKKIKTHRRSLIVVPQMVGMQIQVHNGKTFIPVDVVPEMIGHFLGEFAPTRARIAHTKSGVGATKGSKAKSKK
jgi:small subunit ribosomal protein S19